MNTWAKQKQTGFTIVELLIVIVVIAILATITIIGFNGIQNRASDAVIKADLSNIAKKLELAKIDTGHYPELLAEMPEYKLTKSAYDAASNNAYYCLDKVNQIYSFGARSKSKKGFFQTSNGLQEDVLVSGARTCDAIGTTWGGAGSYVVQGYYSGSYAATNGWYPYWSWVD